MNIKPCPFCGGRSEANSDEYRERFINNLYGSIIEPAAKNIWVFCTVCGARGQTIHDSEYDGYKNLERESNMRKKAIAAWNQRVKEGEAS